IVVGCFLIFWCRVALARQFGKLTREDKEEIDKLAIDPTIGERICYEEYHQVHCPISVEGKHRQYVEKTCQRSFSRGIRLLKEGYRLF
ncbi:hypothetical protein V2J09_020877, partial [Rumex salicifolius]